jgi:hypothetical protein
VFVHPEHQLRQFFHGDLGLLPGVNVIKHFLSLTLLARLNLVSSFI